MQLRHNYSPINKNDKIHARVSCGAHSYLSGCAHFYTFVMSLSSPYTGRVILIPFVVLRSFYIAVSLSIQRSGYAHFTLNVEVNKKLLNKSRACPAALILIQLSDHAHFALSCHSHFHTVVGLHGLSRVEM